MAQPSRMNMPINKFAAGLAQARASVRKSAVAKASQRPIARSPAVAARITASAQRKPVAASKASKAGQGMGTLLKTKLAALATTRKLDGGGDIAKGFVKVGIK